MGVVIIAALLQLPFTSLLGFQRIPVHFYPIIALVVFAYIAAAEASGALFCRKIDRPNYSGVLGATFDQQNASVG